MKLKKDGTPDRRALGLGRGIRSGSTTEWLASFKAGERRWVEAGKDVGATMRKCIPHKSRWPEEIRHMNFSASAWTAVGALGKCRVLVCIERTRDCSVADSFS